VNGVNIWTKDKTHIEEKSIPRVFGIFYTNGATNELVVEGITKNKQNMFTSRNLFKQQARKMWILH